MIGALIGGAGLLTGIGTSIAGGIKGGKAANKQQELINQQKAQNDAWYNKMYYQNYLDSKEAQSAMKRVEETLRKRNQDAQAQAAVTGGTQESVIAQQANDQKLVGDVVEGLASRSDELKRQADYQKNVNDNNLLQQQIAQQQANEAGAAALMKSGGSLIGSALSMAAGDEDLDKLAKSWFNKGGGK